MSGALSQAPRWTVLRIAAGRALRQGICLNVHSAVRGCQPPRACFMRSVTTRTSISPPLYEVEIVVLSLVIVLVDRREPGFGKLTGVRGGAQGP